MFLFFLWLGECLGGGREFGWPGGKRHRCVGVETRPQHGGPRSPGVRQPLGPCLRATEGRIWQRRTAQSAIEMSHTSGPSCLLRGGGVSWWSLAENRLVWRVLFSAWFGFRTTRRNWRAGEERFTQGFLCQVLRVGGAFCFKQAPLSAQIRNRCVEGEEGGRGREREGKRKG